MIHSFSPIRIFAARVCLKCNMLTIETGMYFSAAQLPGGKKLVEAPSTAEVVGDEGGHRLAIVGLNNTGEEGNRSRSALLGEEANDAKLGKTSVVDFGSKTAGLGLLGHVLREFEGIVQVEGNGVGDSAGVRSRDEVGEVTGLATGHVMLVSVGRKLRPELKEGDGSENLPLCGVADSIPKGRGVGLAGERRAVHLHGPGELDAVGVDDVADEGEHGNTAVLDLGVSQEANGGLIGGTPKLSLGKVERIVEANNGVELLGEGLEVSLKII
jgi:hypothetical protein